MNKLTVILYDNDFNKDCNIENLKRNFIRDSGLVPTEILDQPTRAVLINHLLSLNEAEDSILIHIVSHGNFEGIGKTYTDKPYNGDKDTLIEWQELIEHLNSISNNCLKLRVNLGNVCNSYHIIQQQNTVNFDVLFTNTTIMNPVAPRKHNKLLLDKITDGAIDEIYSIYRN